MSTRAIMLLRHKRIPHEVVTYDHATKGAAFAAQSVGFPLARTIKTLVVTLDERSHVLALMPGDRQLSLKRIAAVCGAGKAAMADSGTAERLTGYRVGGISPFGARKHLPAVMDEDLQGHPSVMINGGRRGLLLKMLPGDIIEALGAQIASISR